MKFYDHRFMKIAAPILEHEKYQEMHLYKHHDESVYEHSLRVAYSSYCIAYKLNLDYESIIRGALLHDFYLYRFQKRCSPMIVVDVIKHAAGHPVLALENASALFELSEKEQNIIKSHMFPFGLPKSKEAWVVTYCDKYIACFEYFSNFKKILTKRYHRVVHSNS